MNFDAVAYLESLFTEVENHYPEVESIEELDAQWNGIGPDDLPVEWRLWFEERAAIREYDGGQPREVAEMEALREIICHMKAEGIIPKEGKSDA